jgi:hypothetical protein
VREARVAELGEILGRDQRGRAGDIDLREPRARHRIDAPVPVVW